MTAFSRYPIIRMPICRRKGSPAPVCKGKNEPTVLTESAMALHERCVRIKAFCPDDGEGLLPPCLLGNGGILLEVKHMETRVAVMSIIVENGDAVESINAVLHEYGEYIIGRMGLPYRERRISIISIAMDAPQNVISAVAGKIGTLAGVSVKTAYSSVMGEVVQ